MNKVIIIAGASGSGKDTLVNNLLTTGQYLKLVSDTTRIKRDGEVEGKDYYFVDKETFWHKFKKGDYFQYNDFFGNLYAYTRQELINKIKQKSVLIICHPQVIMLVTFFLKQIDVEYLTIYLDVDKDQALKRMKLRGDKEKDIEKRLTEYAEFEWYKNKADIVLDTKDSSYQVFTNGLLEILKRTKYVEKKKDNKKYQVQSVGSNRIVLKSNDEKVKVETDDGEKLGFLEYFYQKYLIQ